jgi:hypothetical protein
MKTALRLTFITLLLAVSSLSAATLYVSLESTNPTPPYTNWVIAATNIQDAVDVATVGDEVVVTNGIYASGAKTLPLSKGLSRLAVTNAVTVRSVNGPQFTAIQGSQNPGTTNGAGAVRCVALVFGASLVGFTLTNGATSFDDVLGGGVEAYNPPQGQFPLVSNCVIVNNSSYIYGGGASGCLLCNCTLTGNSSSSGGGAVGGVLRNCILAGNTAGILGGGVLQSVLYNCLVCSNRSNNSGGGADSAFLYNCTVTGNWALWAGGGASFGLLYNCVIYFNTAASGAPNCDTNCTLNYCCTMPQPTSGFGNITNAPLFVDYTNGNLRLQSNSPCINSGNNAYVVGSTDLDGNPRIISGTVDMGAYEFQGTGSRISYAWLQQYALPTDGSADYSDPDHDGMNNWQEWICGTCPTNAQSVLRLVSATPAGTNITVTWQSVPGVNYFLERSTNLTSPFTHLASFIMGQAGTTSYADTNAAGAGPMFYRVGVLPSGAN